MSKPSALARASALCGPLPADGSAVFRSAAARLRIAAVTLGALFALSACDEPLLLGEGVHAPDEPQQRAITGSAITLGDFRIAPRAEYAITAKLLGKKRYRFDELAALAPWDYALAWGSLSDEYWLKPTKVTQGDRFMFWHLHESPMNIDIVNRLSANVHLIPASERVLKQIQDTPEGSIVSLAGKLVDVHYADGRVLPSSLTRLDTGPGACEVLYVESMTSTQKAP